MSNIQYSIENTPDASDDKVIRNGIVDFNAKIISQDHKRKIIPFQRICKRR